nr:MAG TPA: hypothetical protein [Caudoviricetes sp.]
MLAGSETICVCGRIKTKQRINHPNQWATTYINNG